MERYQLGVWGAFLATREHGRQVREHVEGRLVEVQPGMPFVLDFSGVRGVTASFGDEFLAKLMVPGGPIEQAGRGIVVEGTSDDVREALQAAVARRNMTAPAMPRPSGGLAMKHGRICQAIHAALGVRA